MTLIVRGELVLARIAGLILTIRIFMCAPTWCVAAGISHELLEHDLASSVCRGDPAVGRRWCLCVRGRCLRGECWGVLKKSVLGKEVCLGGKVVLRCGSRF